MSLFLLWRLWRSRGAHSGSDRRRPQLLRREQPRLAFQPLENRRLLSAAPLGAEFQVNTFTAGNQGWARVASDGDGDFVVVWESQDQDGDSSGIFAQRFNASGVPQGNEFRVNSVTADAQTLPGVAMNDDGDFVIAWSSAVNSTWRTSARRYDSAGVPQGDEFQIPGSYFDPSVAMDADGDCVIAWQSYEGGSWGVSAQRYDQTGASVGERIRANTSPAYINAGPSVAMTADGDFVIAWTSLDDGSGLGIAARRYDAAGVPQADQFRASTSTSGDQENAAVAMHDDGGFIVTWTSVFEFPGAIYAQAYDAAGMPLGDELAVTPVSPTAKGDPRVAINADGEFVVAWYGSEANSLGVYARFYDPDRLPRGAIVRVNTLEAGHQYRPDVAMLGGEDFVVIWQSQDQDSSGDAIIAQRMRAHLIVRNTQDSGPSSLRQAIELANTQAGPDVIAFNIPTTDPGFIDIDSGVTGGDAAPDVVVISPATELPTVIDAVVIDGRTQSAFGANSNSFGPEIVLDGDGIDAAGLTIRADDSSVYGLSIERFGGLGLWIEDASRVIVAGNQIRGNEDWGVRVGNSTNVTIGGATPSARNVISRNNLGGVCIIGGESTNNHVLGNYIGTSVSGEEDEGNGFSGIYTGDGSRFDVPAPGSATNTLIQGNLISGNGRFILENEEFGVWISGDGATGHVVIGNLIGTNAAGNRAIPNGRNGVMIDQGASGNRVGTNGDGVDDIVERNVISGNNRSGVRIASSATSGNIVAGNFIGVNMAGNLALPNGTNGVVIDSGASGNLVGTNGNGVNDAIEGNIIAGNGEAGIFINGIGTAGNMVAGNQIGVSGNLMFGNTLSGVEISHGATANRIGTNGDGVSDAQERNVISGNGGRGVLIFGSGTTGNVVAGNLIGTNAFGSMALPNNLSGVEISGGAAKNLVGTDGDGTADVAERNVIAGNHQVGVFISGGGTTGNVVAGNQIGVNGPAVIANGFSGVEISNGAANNRIGTDGNGVNDVSERNFIAGNRYMGVLILGSGSQGNVVAGNFIGLRAGGAPSGNAFDGVRIGNGASNNRIGGSATSQANTIAFNAQSGVVVVDPNSIGNTIRGNSIHDHQEPGIDLADDGVTRNDDGDVDAGPNHLQNTPVITGVSVLGNTLRVTATLRGAANSPFVVEFFANPSADSSGVSEGETFLGAFVVTTDAAGNASFSRSFSGNFSSRVSITATGTDASGNTSEFSPPHVAPSGMDTIGLFATNPSAFFLRNSNTAGIADLVFGYGSPQASWTPLGGDWDANGSDTVGLYEPSAGVFLLRNSNNAGLADLVYSFGPGGQGWLPLTGDWDGDGRDTVGAYDPAIGVFYLKNSHSPGAADLVIIYGPSGAGWLPLAGDWNGDGDDTIGLYNPASSTFYLRYQHAPGPADVVYQYGPANAGWLPLAGDWNEDGRTTAGLYAAGTGHFYLRNEHAAGIADLIFGYGPSAQGWLPLAGDWDSVSGHLTVVAGPSAAPAEPSSAAPAHRSLDDIDSRFSSPDEAWTTLNGNDDRRIAAKVVTSEMTDAADELAAHFASAGPTHGGRREALDLALTDWLEYPHFPA